MKTERGPLEVLFLGTTLLEEETYEGDAGMDLPYVGPRKVVWPWCIANLTTELRIKVPNGYWGQIKSRSSTFYRKKLLVLEGVIDPGYTGELSVCVFNPTPLPRLVRPDDRLGQLTLHRIEHCTPKYVNEMPTTHRGEKGFGSTGG